MQRKKLPIGIQSFSELRENGSYYVDKTPLILRLIADAKACFLSRPRRFGKSLMLDTIKELFEGNRTLFEGLHAEAHWDWSITHPVVRLGFGDSVIKTPEDLAVTMSGQLSRLERECGVTQKFERSAGRLANLLETVHGRTGRRVVVLVDDYDLPILDNLAEPDLACAVSEGLLDLYSVLKDADAHVRFVFITGVSKVSTAGVFSGLNHLYDITLSRTYSALSGYTEREVETVFAPELAGLDRDHIRQWYYGYHWTGEAVYNPYDLLLLFQERQFRPYWFETATPGFLVEQLARHRCFTPELAGLQTSEQLMARFDPEAIEPEALLWQTGYLTIREVREVTEGLWFYTLAYPNRAVESALNDALLSGYGVPRQTSTAADSRLNELLLNGDMAGFEANLRTLYASIPHDWCRNNPLSQDEGFYASVFYSHLAALGMDTRVEDATNKGRIDLALRVGDRVYLFAFKVVEQVPDGRALAQLQARSYAEKYQEPGVSILLVGVEFSREERNVVGFEVAEG